MAKSSVFKLFGTSKVAEKEGVWVNYGDIKFLVARAGGSNIAYAELLKAKIRPVRHQIDRDTLSKAEDDRINAELYAEVIIKDVQVRVSEEGVEPEEWKKGLPTEDGEVVPFTVGGVTKLLLDLPDLFRDIRVCASDASKYLKSQEDADVKNSKQS